MRVLGLLLALVAVPAGAVDSGYDLDIRLAGGAHAGTIAEGRSAHLEVAIRPATADEGECAGVEITPSACFAFAFKLNWPPEALELVDFATAEGLPQGWPTPTFNDAPGSLLMGAFSTGPALAAEAVILELELRALQADGQATVSAIEVDFGDSGGRSICGAFDTPGDAGVPGDYWDELLETTLSFEAIDPSLGVYELLPPLREP